jgi:hypothetical protein
MIFNVYELTGSGIRHHYQQEFEHYRSLAAARAACRRSGQRDGLVRFHASFVGRVTDEIVAMLPEENRAVAAPGPCVQGCYGRAVPPVLGLCLRVTPCCDVRSTCLTVA